MAKRVVLHVSGTRGQWEIKEEGRKQAMGIFRSKPEAISRARREVKKHELAQIKVHGMDGRIQTEFTYGKDPRDKRG